MSFGIFPSHVSAYHAIWEYICNMNDFFSIISGTTNESGAYVYTLELNADHSIFKGHFPGKPVVPGVLTLMMTRKCAEKAANLGETRISFVKEAKYIAPIKPDGRKVVVTFTVDDAKNIKADVTADDGELYTKVRMTLTEEA